MPCGWQEVESRCDCILCESASKLEGREKGSGKRSWGSGIVIRAGGVESE